MNSSFIIQCSSLLVYPSPASSLQTTKCKMVCQFALCGLHIFIQTRRHEEHEGNYGIHHSSPCPLLSRGEGNGLETQSHQGTKGENRFITPHPALSRGEENSLHCASEIQD